MKQLLTVVLCVVLVGMTAGSVRAETGIGGYFMYKYLLLDGSDDSYVVLNFNSQVNDKATGYLSLTVSGVADRFFRSDYFCVIYKEKYGTYTLGRFSYGTGNLSLLGSAVGALISDIGIKFEYPCLEVLNLKFGYFHGDPGYFDDIALGCDYRFEKVFIGLNLVKQGDEEMAGFTMNVSVDLNAGSKIYFHYGQDQDINRKGVLGYNVGFSKIPLLITAECSFIPDLSNNVDYGCSLKYEISKKAVLSYLYVGNGTTATRSELMMFFFY